MRAFGAVTFLCAVVLTVFPGHYAFADECSCMNMSSNACRRWGSSGKGFYWITDSVPSSSTTLTSGPCGSSGESGTAYIYAYLNASAGQCDGDMDTPCNGNNSSYGRYAKIKVSGSQKAFQHIFPDGLSFRGNHIYWGEHPHYSGVSITETNTECDLKLADNSQVLRIVLDASVAQCDSSFSGSKFTIQIKFYEARNEELTQFSMLDAVSGSLTVDNNLKTSFDPENFIPDVKEGTANGWIEKTTYDLSNETTDDRWLIEYLPADEWGTGETVTTGLEETSTSAPGTLIPSSPTVYRLKLPGFRRSMHDLPGYAAQAGWSYKWDTNETYIQYKGEGKVIRFYCESPADNSETNRRYLIRRVECISGEQQPENQWYINYTYNSPAKIANIHNGSDPNDPNTVNSATIQYLYEWDGDTMDVSYKTRPTTAGTWQAERQWQVEFDDQKRPIKYDAGCSSGCSGGGEFENVTYLDPDEYDLTGYEYLVKEKKDANGVVILQNSYQEIDFGEWVPAYWLYLTNMSFELPVVSDCEEQTDDFTGWNYISTPASPYVEICHYSGDPNSSTIPDGNQYVRPNGHTIEKAFECYLSPQTQYYLSAQIRADVDSQHTSRAIIELYFDDGYEETLLSIIDANDVGQAELVEGQWVMREDREIDCPQDIEELTEGVFILKVWGEYVDIDDIYLSGSIWVAGNSKPVVVEQKVYDENANPPGLKTAMTRSFDTDNLVVTEKRYISSTEYRLTKYYYTDRAFNRLASKVEYEDTSGDALNGDMFTTSFGGNDPNRIFITTYPNGKRADYQIYDDSGNVVESYVVNLDNDVNSLRETFTYENMEYYEYYGDPMDYRLKTHTNARGGISTYTYGDNSPYLLTSQTDPNTSVGQQETSYVYDDARRVIREIRRLDAERNLNTDYNYNPTTGFLDSMTVNEATTCYKYNTFGQVIRQTNPDNIVTGKSYGSGGELVSEFVIDKDSDPNDLDTSLYLISQTRYTYTDDGKIEFVGKYKADDKFLYQSDMATNPDNWILAKYEYYKNGRKKKTIEDYGTGRTNLTTEYLYNWQGEIEKVLYPTGKWVQTVRDGRGLVIEENVGYGTYPDETVLLKTGYGYDKNGNLKWQSNPDGSVLVYTYDNYDRLKRTYQGSETNGSYTEKFYNDAGDVIREIACEPNGLILSDSRTEYDKPGNVVFERLCYEPNSIDNEADFTHHYEYDIAGNLRFDIKAKLASIEPNGITTEFRINDQGRRSIIVDPNGFIYSQYYTQGGLVYKSIDPNNPDDPNAFTTWYDYDRYGRLEKTTNPLGHYTVNTYNSLNQITKQVFYDCKDFNNPSDDIPVRQIRTVYDNFGNVTRQAVMADPNETGEIVLGTDLVTDYIFEPNGLLSEQKMYVGSSATAKSTTFGYDPIGRRILTTDPEGNWEKIYYNTDEALGSQVVKTEQFENDPDGSNDYTITVFNLYDVDGRLSARLLDEDASGDISSGDPNTSFAYDGLNRVSYTTAPDGVVTFTAYDGFGNVKQTIEDYGTGTENRETEFIYNKLNQQCQVNACDPNDTTSHIAIQTTTYEYNPNGLVKKITYSDDKFVEYEYNLLRKVEIETKRDGSKIYYWYDQLGNLVAESDDPDGWESTYTPGFLTEFQYDGINQLTYAYKALDNEELSESSFTYNGFGARTSETAQYDSNITKTTYWTYDGSGNRLTQTHGNTVLTYTHDGLGRIRTIDKGDDQIVSYAYLGRNTQSIDYPQAETSQHFGYNELGRIDACQSIDPNDQTILDFQYTYDEVGNRETCKYNHLATPVWDVYGYDSLRRLTHVTYADDDGYVAMNFNIETLSMDDLVLVASAWVENKPKDYNDYADYITNNSVHPANPVKKYSAVDVAQVKRKILSLAKTVNNPEIKKLVDSIKSVAPMAYNPDAPIYTLVEFGEDVPKNYRAESVLNEDDEIIAQIIYDNKDRIVLFAMYPDSGGTVVVSMTYDKLGNITSNYFTVFDADGNIIDTVDVLAQQETLVAESTMSAMSMSLDSSAIMMSSTPEALVAKTDEFGYDHLGNRTTVYLNKNTMAQEMLEYSHNLVNQYSGIESSFLNGTISTDYSVSHDDNGNLSTDTEGNSYFYDYRNRLVEVQDPNSNTIAEYAFDALGRRISKTVGSETTYFFYDPQGRIIAEYEGSTPDLTREYVFGNGQTEILAMFTPYHEGDTNDWNAFIEFVESWLCQDPNDACYDGTYDHNSDAIVNFTDFSYFAGIWDIPSDKESDWYYLTDALGSVRGLVGGRFQRESDREFYNYDVYGNLPIQDDEESKSGNPYLFAGYRYDAETRLYHTDYRAYDPETGRWLSFDRGFFDSWNLYEYCVSNPSNHTDPLGLAIYAFDGTGQDKNNISPGGDITNVGRLFDAYNAATPEWRRNNNFYRAGVGTYEDEKFGGVGGQGGRRLVEEAYQQLVQNFKNRDTEIVIIGFSRGAALAREFANMIDSRGDPLGEGIDIYKGTKLPIGVCYSNGESPKIKFLGIYDTVGSFGKPGNKTDIGKDFYVPDNVQIVRHAVAIHERRDNFELTSIYPREGYTDPTGRLVEKAFPGAHSDVGGGYADNYLAREPLMWMATEAAKAGVRLDGGALNMKSMQSQPNGTGVHNSNCWFWWWRSHPIMSPEQVQKIERLKRNIFYYDAPKERLRR